MDMGRRVRSWARFFISYCLTFHSPHQPHFFEGVLLFDSFVALFKDGNQRDRRGGDGKDWKACMLDALESVYSTLFSIPGHLSQPVADGFQITASSIYSVLGTTYEAVCNPKTWFQSLVPAERRWMHSQVATHCDALSFALLVDSVCTCMYACGQRWTSGQVDG